jgi:CubicO group peptidase (beta-lactamase class C family)
MHTMQSVSKTVTSVICGAATTRGDFKAGLVDVAKVKNVDDRKRRMTLKDLLTMTTGLKSNEEAPYDDPRSDCEGIYHSPYLLAKSTPPGRIPVRFQVG